MPKSVDPPTSQRTRWKQSIREEQSISQPPNVKTKQKTHRKTLGLNKPKRSTCQLSNNNQAKNKQDNAWSIRQPMNAQRPTNEATNPSIPQHQNQPRKKNRKNNRSIRQPINGQPPTNEAIDRLTPKQRPRKRGKQDILRVWIYISADPANRRPINVAIDSLPAITITAQRGNDD